MIAKPPAFLTSAESLMSMFYDLVRWKKALSYYNKPFYGWDVRQETVENYNRLRVMRSVNFQHKHYLWPIKEYDLIINPNLVQNPGW